MTPERVVERILDRVEVDANGCWLWPGAKTNGYGQIAWTEDGKACRGLTHRLIFEARTRDLEPGEQVDHLCHDPSECSEEIAANCQHRACCNPDHLTAATSRQNVLRGGSFAASNAVKDSCPGGHPYDADNTYVAPNGWRQCHRCRAAHIQAFKARRKALVN